MRRIACELDLCGVDLVEVSPPYDVAGITAMAGQRVIQEALGGIALRRSGTRGAARTALTAAHRYDANIRNARSSAASSLGISSAMWWPLAMP